MAADTKLPGHQRQLVPGVNSNPNPHEAGEAVMSNLQYESITAEPPATFRARVPSWAIQSKHYHAGFESDDVAVEHVSGRIGFHAKVGAGEFAKIEPLVMWLTQDILETGEVQEARIYADLGNEPLLDMEVSDVRRLVEKIQELLGALDEEASK